MSDFMMHIGIESHARLVNEWGFFKNKAETTAEELETVTQVHDALRRALHQVLGVPFDERRSDAELMGILGAQLEQAHTGVPERGYVAYGDPAGPASMLVDLPFRPPVEGYKAVSPDEAPRTDPWTAPAQDGPPARPFRLEQEYAVDPAAQPPRQDEGPSTESMQPVEQPPTTPDGYTIGRVFTRGDQCPGQESLDLVINRSGDVMRVFTEGCPEGEGVVVRRDGSEATWEEQLHMNGTLWELVCLPIEQAGEQVPSE